MALSGREPCPPATRFGAGEVARRTIRALPALAAPVLILGAMRTGAVTATEAGMLATAYALLLGVPYGGFTGAKLGWAISDSVITTANILWLIAISTVMGHILTIEGVAQALSVWMANVTQSPLVALAVINLGLLVLGCILETTPALLITSPILAPIVMRYGVDPVHFGVVVCLNLIIGIITPPMGIGLFAVAGVTRLPVETVTRATLPYLIPLLLALVLITYVPALTLWLPDLVMGPALRPR